MITVKFDMVATEDISQILRENAVVRTEIVSWCERPDVRNALSSVGRSEEIVSWCGADVIRNRSSVGRREVKVVERRAIVETSWRYDQSYRVFGCSKFQSI